MPESPLEWVAFALAMAGLLALFGALALTALEHRRAWYGAAVSAVLIGFSAALAPAAGAPVSATLCLAWGSLVGLATAALLRKVDGIGR